MNIFKRLLLTGLLFPVFGMLSVVGDEGGSGGGMSSEAEKTSDAKPEEDILSGGGESAGEDAEDAEGGEEEQPATSWYSHLPEEAQDKFKDLSAEDAVAALERGQGYTPAASAEEITFEAPQGFPEDAVGKIKTFAVENGLTPKQATEAFNFYVNEEVKRVVEDKQKTIADLKHEYGSQYESVVKNASTAVDALERKIPGLWEGAKSDGLVNNRWFIKMANEFRKHLKESDMSGGDPGRGEAEELTRAEEYERKRKV